MKLCERNCNVFLDLCEPHSLVNGNTELEEAKALMFHKTVQTLPRGGQLELPFSRGTIKAKERNPSSSIGAVCIKDLATMLRRKYKPSSGVLLACGETIAGREAVARRVSGRACGRIFDQKSASSFTMDRLEPVRAITAEARSMSQQPKGQGSNPTFCQPKWW